MADTCASYFRARWRALPPMPQPTSTTVFGFPAPSSGNRNNLSQLTVREGWRVEGDWNVWKCPLGSGCEDESWSDHSLCCDRGCPLVYAQLKNGMELSPKKTGSEKCRHGTLHPGVVDSNVLHKIETFISYKQTANWERRMKGVGARGSPGICAHVKEFSIMSI